MEETGSNYYDSYWNTYPPLVTICKGNAIKLPLTVTWGPNRLTFKGGNFTCLLASLKFSAWGGTPEHLSAGGHHRASVETLGSSRCQETTCGFACSTAAPAGSCLQTSQKGKQCPLTQSLPEQCWINGESQPTVHKHTHHTEWYLHRLISCLNSLFIE